MRFAFIDSRRGSHSVEKMARILKVSRSGYYAWRVRPRSKRSESDEVLLGQIAWVQHKAKYRYGSKRLSKALQDRGIQAGHGRVARLTRVYGLQARRRRPFRVTTNSKHRFPIAPNLLDREFDVGRMNYAYVSDITYLATADGWMYLCTVIDLATRKVVGWSLGTRLTADLVVDAINAAVMRQRPPRGVIFHSDRGTQYASRAVRRCLKRHGFIQSMSRKGDCWDNAVAESFFKTLKVELCTGKAFKSRETARLEVFEYIEVFYNRERLHSKLGYMTPVAFEQSVARCAA